ncbi:TIGR04283 family arsenosugar biosynthesis glycosyltransferase [Rhodobacteraceae bacterium NNCM2]|nr:TIGR04283 family arsenosugar biosynthesis glycosyltransferase [Coraliihabitans acroporae]
MSAPLSVIIPTLNAADRLGPTLGALGSGVIDGLIREVVIVDGGSTDDVADVAEIVGATFLTAAPGRGVQLAKGAEAATGDWLLFLHADTVLGHDWCLAVRRHIEETPDHAGFFGLRFDAPGFMAWMTAGWANLRSHLFALPYGDQGLLVPRVLYAKSGGYPAIPLMEDVALVRRIGRAHLTSLPSTVTTSAERYRREGWLRRGARNLSTLALYNCGVPVERLARRYHK